MWSLRRGRELEQEGKIDQAVVEPSEGFYVRGVCDADGVSGVSLGQSRETGGSRVTMENAKGDALRLHKPHPANILKAYQVEKAIEQLEERNLI